MRIFISYRREDTSGYAGRLFDTLTEAFGRDSVFMDIDSLAPGENFVDVIDAALRGCEVALVLIGPNWLTIRDQQGRRLDAPNDFVRQEIAASLARGIRVLPLLVGGATMPAIEALPAPIAELARRHAFELTDRRWHADVNELVAALGGHGRQVHPQPGRSRRPMFAAGGAAAAIIAVVVALVLLLHGQGGGTQLPPTPTPTASGPGRLAADATTSSGAQRTVTFLMQNDGKVVYVDIQCYIAGYPGKSDTSNCLDHDTLLDGSPAVASNYFEVFSGVPSTACGTRTCEPGPPASGIYVLSITLVTDSVFHNLEGAGSLELKGYFSVAVQGGSGLLAPQYSVIRLNGVPTAQAPQ